MLLSALFRMEENALMRLIFKRIRPKNKLRNIKPRAVKKNFLLILKIKNGKIIAQIIRAINAPLLAKKKTANKLISVVVK